MTGGGKPKVVMCNEQDLVHRQVINKSPNQSTRI